MSPNAIVYKPPCLLHVDPRTACGPADLGRGARLYRCGTAGKGSARHPGHHRSRSAGGGDDYQRHRAALFRVRSARSMECSVSFGTSGNRWCTHFS